MVNLKIPDKECWWIFIMPKELNSSDCSSHNCMVNTPYQGSDTSIAKVPPISNKIWGNIELCWIIKRLWYYN